jgi:TRAP-type mannitol/chloroaromatic compound transport system permease small subunit
MAKPVEEVGKGAVGVALEAAPPEADPPEPSMVEGTALEDEEVAEEQGTKVTRAIDGYIRRIGAVVSWLAVVLVAVIVLQVILRYAFGKGLVALEELQWHLYAVLIMIGIPYGIVANSHIRLDVLHRSYPHKAKELIELIGIVFLLFPMIVVLFMHGLDFVESSLRVNERSDSPLGLPFRWVIKSVIPLSMLLLSVAAGSRAVRAVVSLWGRNKEKEKA